MRYLIAQGTALETKPKNKSKPQRGEMMRGSSPTVREGLIIRVSGRIKIAQSRFIRAGITIKIRIRACRSEFCPQVESPRKRGAFKQKRRRTADILQMIMRLSASCAHACFTNFIATPFMQ